MTDLSLPSIFVPLVGLVFRANAMASLFLHVQKIRLSRSDETKLRQFFSTLDHNKLFL